MKPLLCLAVALAASLLLYAGVFSVVHRPLTVGDIPRMLQAKAAYARGLASPKLVIFAGSNGRFSHRCDALAAASGRPCVNLSLAVGIGLDFMFDQVEPLLQRGDIVYLPLEYGQYRVEREEMAAGAQNAVLVHDLREQLWRLPLPRIARAWGSFDLPFLVQGLVEMGLAQTGFQRRTGIDSLTPQGDEKGHTPEAGRAYAAALRNLRFDTTPLPARSHAMAVLGGFLDRMRDRGVLVVGGLPTTPDDVSLDDAGIERLRQFFADHGQRWLQLPNRSQYPLSCFHDTLYHLNEPCQIAHSTRVGNALAALR